VRKQQEQIQVQQQELVRLNTTVTSLECLVATLQERLDKAEDRVEATDTRNYELEEQVEGLGEEIPDTEEIAEDVLNRIRAEVYEQIEERMGDVLARMRNALGTYFAPTWT
jgi:predicted  nucleic acid-binding Zn-ribbon protein